MLFIFKKAGIGLIFLYSVGLFAQSHYEKGKAFYDEKDYAQAIKSFEKAHQKDPESADVLNYLGSSYYYNEDYEEAIMAFNKLQEADSDYWAWYIYLRGEAHLNLDQLDEAIEDYRLFKTKYSTDPTRTLFHHQADFRISYAEGRKQLLNAPPLMPDPENLGKTINSGSGEYFPQIDPTGKTLYFTSQRKSRLSHLDGDNDKWGEDLYTAKVNSDGTFGEPVLMPEPINSNEHDGAATFTGDGQIMVYSRCPNEGGVGNCDLYISQLDGDSWSDPTNLGNVVNSKEWDAQASISADGTTIIFASNRPGGYGGSDLYMIKRNKFGEWGVPQNLGSMVNTPWSENSPYIAPDGRTLYFSSWGHPGLGGFDIFKSTLDNNQWSIPENLGQPLNSTGNDKFFTISASGEHAYFASERDGGLGQLDLYQVEIPEDMRPQATAVVSGVVTNAKDQQPISARIIIEDLNSGELVATNKSNSKTGEYLIVLPSGRTYGVTAYQKGYFFYSQSFDVPKESQYQELTKNIELKPIEKGARVVLNNIFFETGKAELSPESRLDLDKAIELMQTNPSMVVEVGGHTDNVGDEANNMRLSHERAKSVRQYIVDAGIASQRIEAKGYGETTPVADNDTEEGRAANRRTEFIILEF
jgi:outer membrane protein OmpA-like peptidoglycan-associated protein